MKTKTVKIKVPVESRVIYEGEFPETVFLPMARHEAEAFLEELRGHPHFDDPDYSGVLRWVGDRLFNALQGTGGRFDRNPATMINGEYKNDLKAGYQFVGDLHND